MANIKSIGGNPIVLGLDGLTEEAKAALGNGKLSSTSESLLGTPDTAQWATRESTGSGAATVRSVQGAAVAWNQMIKKPVYSQTGSWNLTVENVNDEYLIINANNDTGESKYLAVVQGRDGIADMMNGHVYYISTKQDEVPFYINLAGANTVARGARIVTLQVDASNTAQMILAFYNNVTVTNLKVTPQIFDLTQMFGSGNEPSTVAEFERMFPEAYYPYSAPTLKPVQIAGIASTDAQGGELDSVEWTAQTLRAAGTIRDELTAGELVTRVRVVDLGTLTWTKGNALTDGTGTVFYAGLTTKAPSNTVPDCKCAELNPVKFTSPYEGITKGDVFTSGSTVVVGGDSSLSASEFKASMSGVILYAQWATPITTPISPALPMTYRVEQGGTESIIVPDGEVSAAPVLTIAEGESASELVMDALACIATPDGPVATSNHALGTYLTMGGKLYKVTSAIAVGETITAGTNVTATTVMDEILALN